MTHQSVVKRSSAMDNIRRLTWLICAICLTTFVCMPAQADIASVSQAVAVSLSPAIKLLTVPATATLLPNSVAFAAFTGSFPISFRVRTSPSGGATITVGASEFFPTTGPKIANGDLAYTCGGSTIGSGCNSATVMTPGYQTNLVSVDSNACTGGGSPCSDANPNSVTMTVSVKNSPAFLANTYASTITFTASSL
jgi:hypothetical protein